MWYLIVSIPDLCIITYLVKGIDFRYNDNQIKKKLAAEEHGITHVEHMYMDGRPTGTVKLSFNTPIAPLRVGNEENGFISVEPSYFQSLKCSQCQKMGHGTRRCKAKVPRCARCAGGHWTTECTRWYYTECANCHSLEHGAAYRGCPIVMEFEKQTRQRNIMIKTNYERLLREEKDRELAQSIQSNDQSNLVNNHPEPQKEKNKIRADTEASSNQRRNTKLRGSRCHCSCQHHSREDDAE